MTNHNFFQNVHARAAFDQAKVTKIDCFRSPRLFVGLTCLVRGQQQSPHTHADVDKFYLVLQGKARITVGDDTDEMGPGGLVWAPAGVAHGIAEALEDCIVLVTMAPASV